MLEEICICGIVFSDRDSGDIIMTHLLVNWPSSTAKFYSCRTNQPELAMRCFPVHLVQTNITSPVSGEKKRKTVSWDVENERQIEAQNPPSEPMPIGNLDNDQVCVF